MFVVGKRSRGCFVRNENRPIALKPIITLSPCLAVCKYMNPIRKNPDRVNRQGKTAPCLPVWISQDDLPCFLAEMVNPGLTIGCDYLHSIHLTPSNDMTTQNVQRIQHAPKTKGRKMVPTMVKMEPQLRDSLQRLADEQGMTLSAYLRRVYQEHLCFSEAA